MATATARIGDVFVRSWGYDQTNVDYYELVEVSRTGKTGKARKLKTVAVEQLGQSDRVTAATGPDRFATDPGCARCSNRHQGERGWDGHAFTDLYTWQARHDRVTTGYGHAWRWDGQPDYQTASGWGH
jgi:hypothetical protein